MVSSAGWKVALAATVLTTLLTGCGSGPEAGDGTITLYSGRTESLIKPLLERFSEETGIEVEARYGTTSQLAAQLLEEGDGSPAEVFLSQDAGALGAVNKANLLGTLPQQSLQRVPATYRSDDGRWVGVSGRSRVLAYNPDLVPKEQLPTSVLELTEPQWKGKVGVVPANASFQAFVTALRVQHGEDKAKEFLSGLKANDAQIRDGNLKLVEDVDAGRLPVGLVNHYYLGELAHERGVAPESMKVKLHFFPGGDTGALVNAAGVGVLKGSAADPDSQRLVEYLLGPEVQRYFAAETSEYPLVSGVEGPKGVPPLSELTGPAIDLNDLEDLQTTIGLIKQSGLAP